MESRQIILYAAEYLGVIAVLMIAGLSPRLQIRRPLGFKYPLREGVISLGLFVLALILSFVIYINFYTPIQPDRLIWQRLTVAWLSLAPFIIALFQRGQPVRSAGWSRAMLGPAFRVGLALVFLTVFLRGKFMAVFQGTTQQDWIALLAWLGIVIAEETIFRGYIQPRLASWIGVNYGWIVTALLFAIWQLPHLLGTPETLFLNFGLAFAQGLVLGWVMRKTGHVLSPILYRAVSEWVGML